MRKLRLSRPIKVFLWVLLWVLFALVLGIGWMLLVRFMGRDNY